MGVWVGGLEGKGLAMIEACGVAFVGLGNPKKTIILDIKMEHFQQLDKDVKLT